LERNSHGDINNGRLIKIKVAFYNADFVISSKQNEEKLIPNYLEKIELENKYPQIFSSLTVIEKSYEKKLSEDLCLHSITLLDSILNLESSLFDLKKISKKINKLQSSPEILKKFGVDKEFISALDNSRIIRNIKVAHKDLPLKFNIPFMVSTSFAYLVITFLEITICTGELIN